MLAAGWSLFRSPIRGYLQKPGFQPVRMFFCFAGYLRLLGSDAGRGTGAGGAGNPDLQQH